MVFAAFLGATAGQQRDNRQETMADEACKGQEALMNALSSWQSTLAHMSVPHADEKAAAASLRRMHQVTMGHLAQLESHAKAVDQAVATKARYDLLRKSDQSKRIQHYISLCGFPGIMRLAR